LAMARPMPRLPPVIRALRPFMLSCMRRLLWFQAIGFSVRSSGAGFRAASAFQPATHAPF
jgi:hypothetical protein